MCGHENDEVPFDMLLGIGPEQSPHDRDVADDWRPVLCLLHVFAHEPAQNHG